MTLKTTTKTYLEVHYSDLERFIEQRYGMPYSVATALEASNGAYYVYTAAACYQHYDPNAEPGEWFTEREGLDPEVGEIVRAWRDGAREVPGVDELLHDLACSGAIPTGEYLIHVFW
ncbi:hypothetical protein AB0H73_10070 [Streptomyces olivoreticuli]